MIVRNGKITAIGQNLAVPPDLIVVDCKGKFIYPSFIDLYADYGITTTQRTGGGGGGFGPAQLS